jgi:hypothetical protein
MAQRALVSVVDKDSKLVLSRLVDGISLSYQFQMQVFGACKGMTRKKLQLRRAAVATITGKGAVHNESIFSRLYSLFKSTKTTRQGFLHALLRHYESESVCSTMPLYSSSLEQRTFLAIHHSHTVYSLLRPPRRGSLRDIPHQ